LYLALAAAKLRVSARDQEAATDASAVATFVPPQADIGRRPKGSIAFGIRKTLIDMTHPKDLRIRNAWVRGSNPLCGTKFYL
jgi:hypothetical protein